MAPHLSNIEHQPHRGSDQLDQIGRRVIVVDDDADLLGAMDALLTAWGLTVMPFSTFEGARAGLIAGRWADTLLVDVRLGSFNGLQLVHLAKQMDPAMTVIAMSGFDDPVLRVDAERIGATFLLKPVEPSELKRQLFGP